MDAPHFHLIINHVPIVGTIISIFILLIGLLLRNRDLIKTALSIFILGAIITIPVFFSGEAAEEIVEDLPGISELYLEDHEEMGETAMMLLETLGFLAIVNIGFVIRKHKMDLTFSAITLVVAIMVSIYVGMTANSGGKIMHKELRETEMTY